MFAKHLLSVVALGAMAAVPAMAAPLDGIPHGDFSGFPGSTPDWAISGVGAWTSYASANASSTLSNGGGNDHVELDQQWTTAGSATWYTSNNSTSATEAWKVGADYKWVASGSLAYKYFILMNGDVNSSNVFVLTFRNSNIDWSTPTSSGSFTPTTDIGANYQTVALNYNPLNGQASATWGNETIFNTTTTAGLTVRTLYMGNSAGGDYQPGQLWVDNVFAQAQAVPEPASLGLLALGGLLATRRTRRFAN